MLETPRQKGILALFILVLGFGLIAISARYMSFYFSLFQQLYLSSGVAFIISLFIFPRTLTWRRIKRIPRRDQVIMLLRIIFGSLLASSLYRESLVLTKISNVTFIQSIPFNAIFGFLLLKEKFNLKKLGLLIVAFIGVLLISVQDYASVWHFGRGEVFSLISSAVFALSFLSRKWQSDQLSNKEITQILLFFTTVVLVIASLVTGEGLPDLNWDIMLYFSILTTGILSVTNLLLINYGFRHVRAVLASNILTLEGVFATLLAILFYREFPSAKELAGGLIILLSIFKMNRLDSKENAK